MPELPEVRSTIDGLKKHVIDKVISDIWTDWPKMVKKPDSFSDFKSIIKGKTIKDIIQRGKNIVFNLSDDYSLLVHQKLTGHLLYGKWEEKQKDKWVSKTQGPMSEDKMNSYIRFIFFFKDGNQMALSDLRRFAKIELDKSDKIEKELNDSLGPSALDVSVKDFEKRVTKKKQAIKKVIMDQAVINGVGNIYSDEALFNAKIHPLKKANKLNEKELKALCHAIKEVLKKAIKHNGTSVSDYRTPNGEKGSF